MKKMTCIVITLLLVFSVLPFQAAAAESFNIFINGERAALNAMAEKIEGTIYVSIRIVATALGADNIIWNKDTCTANIFTDDILVEASSANKFIKTNNRYFYTSAAGCLYRKGYILMQADALCWAMGADMLRNDNNIYIMSGSSPVISGDEYYNDDDLYWLSRIIHAEAQGEIFEGKIAVGNVVINRKNSNEFPDKIYDIIFDNACGEQFTPAWNGAIYCEPSEESIIAAKIALEGCDITSGCLYFASSKIAYTCWAGKNRPYVTQIENHVFFA